MANRFLFVFVSACVITITLAGCDGGSAPSATETTVPLTPTAVAAVPPTPVSGGEAVRERPYAGLAPGGSQARLGKGRLSEAVYSPDGSVLVVGGSLGVSYYDSKTLEFLGLDYAVGQVGDMGFSSDGRLLTSVSWGYAVKIWDVPREELSAPLEGYQQGFYEQIYGMAFSPDGGLLAKGLSDKTVKIWEASSGRLVATLEGHEGDVESVAFSPDGSLLASGGFDGSVKLWDVSRGELVAALEGHASSVESLAFSPDGSLLASSSWDDTVKIWEVASRELVETLEGHTDWVFSVAFSPDGGLVASGSGDHTVKIWEVSSWELVATLEGHTGTVFGVAFSPDGHRLASTSSNSQWVASTSSDETVKVWEVSSGELVATLGGHTMDVESVVFSPDGSLLASGSWDDRVKIWQVSSGELLATLEGHAHHIESVAFSPDGDLLASGSADETIKLWQVSSGELVATLEGHTLDVDSVAFSPDGDLLASVSWDGTVKIWEVSSGVLVETLEGHSDWVHSVAFSPDGILLASGSADGTVKIWGISSGSLLATLEGDTGSALSVAFSPDSRLLAVGSVIEPLTIWEVYSRELVAILDVDSIVYSIAFSPDGRLLAAGEDDNTVQEWDISRRELVATLKGHTQEVSSVAFSPDGDLIASGSFDGTAVLWDSLIPAYMSSPIVDAFDVPMVRILAGRYSVGGTPEESLELCLQYRKDCQLEWYLDEEPIHPVELDEFLIDQFEVTNARYAACVEAGECNPPELSASATRETYYGDPTYDNYPVIYVTWEHAQAYCEWRGARLPTEAEWETAARGLWEGTVYPWGVEPPVCNSRSIFGAKFDDEMRCNDTDTTAVGYYVSNAYLIYDMAGNVMEWTADWYDVFPGGDPTVSDEYGETFRVARGGSWYTYGDGLRVNVRFPTVPTASFDSYGFRCASSP